jgi:hypothetical protein
MSPLECESNPVTVADPSETQRLAARNDSRIMINIRN